MNTVRSCTGPRRKPSPRRCSTLQTTCPNNRWWMPAPHWTRLPGRPLSTRAMAPNGREWASVCWKRSRYFGRRSGKSMSFSAAMPITHWRTSWQARMAKAATNTRKSRSPPCSHYRSGSRKCCGIGASCLSLWQDTAWAKWQRPGHRVHWRSMRQWRWSITVADYKGWPKAKEKWPPWGWARKLPNICSKSWRLRHHWSLPVLIASAGWPSPAAPNCSPVLSQR